MIRMSRGLPASAIREPQRELSGPHWCDRFPGDRTTATLRQPFRRGVIAFITALERAGAHVSIASTHRPIERAYLMRCAWDVFHHKARPGNLPRLPGVDIEWVHPTPEASWEACRAMYERYSLRHKPSLTSRHIEGRAIDMAVVWGGTITVQDANGRKVSLSTAQGTDMNPELHQVGATYGVIKLVSDPPHWSDDGR
jgi:hypothetical protein